MLLSRKFAIDVMSRGGSACRGRCSKTATRSFGNAEQFEKFLTYSMGPWLSLFEFAINGQLILQPKFYAEFTRDAIARGEHRSANVARIRSR
jgi:hypothetical protein